MSILRHKEKAYEHNLRNIVRLFFIILITFEFFNLLSILRFTLEFTYLGLLITALVSWTTLEFVARRYQKLKHHPLHWVIWLILFFGLAFDAFGDFFHFYGRFDWWDRFVHFSVSSVVCFTLFVIITAFFVDKFKFSLLLKSGRMKLSLYLAGATTLAFGALYEIEEYTEDLLFNTNRLGPGTDTADDLLLNALGTATVIIGLTIYYRITHKRKVLD